MFKQKLSARCFLCQRLCCHVAVVLPPGLHYCYSSALVLTSFRLTKGCATFFYPKPLLLVSFTWWCYFANLSSIMKYSCSVIANAPEKCFSKCYWKNVTLLTLWMKLKFVFKYPLKTYIFMLFLLFIFFFKLVSRTKNPW